jgi:cytochrome c oxidase assembly factor CtaG
MTQQEDNNIMREIQHMAGTVLMTSKLLPNIMQVFKTFFLQQVFHRHQTKEEETAHETQFATDTKIFRFSKKSSTRVSNILKIVNKNIYTV